jgi:glycosyltransferase involved in cell wall biosynthesis
VNAPSPHPAGPGDPSSAPGTLSASSAEVVEAADSGRSTGARGDRPSVTLVVPAYNEATIIMGTLRALEDYMNTLQDEFRWEMVVVNDGSKDETGPIAEAFAASRPNVRVLHHRTNFNLGQSLRFAFGHCTTDYVVTVDCDLSYSVDHIGRLLRAIHETKAKVVLASPYATEGEVANVPFTRKLLSRYANRMLSFAVKGELSTLTGMVRAYDRVFLQSLDLSSVDVGINTEIIYKARILKAKVVEIPARLAWVSEEPGGRVSKFKIARSISTYLLSGFLFRPLFVFMLPAVVFLLLSVGCLAVVVRQALVQGVSLGSSIGDSPSTMIIGAIAFVVAVQFLSLGLLAEQARRNFEHLFHLGTANLRATQRLRFDLDEGLAQLHERP